MQATGQNERSLLSFSPTHARRLFAWLSLLALTLIVAGAGAQSPREQRSARGRTKLPKPVAAWSFEQADGDFIADASGHGYNAHSHGGSHLVQGPNGKLAMEFDGSGDNGAWRGAAQNCGLSIDKALTRAFQEISVAAWMRKTPAWWMSMVYRDSWDAPSGFGLCAEWSAGKVAFGHYDHSGHKSYVQSETTVQDGQWHYVVGTMQPAAEGKGYLYRIYVDGRLDAEQTGAWGIEAAPGDAGMLKIAYPNSSGAERPYQGALADLAIFDVALTPAQVKACFEAGRGEIRGPRSEIRKKSEGRNQKPPSLRSPKAADF